MRRLVKVVVLMANDKQAKDELLTELRAADEALYRCWRVAPIQSGVAALIDYAQKRVQEAITIRREKADD